MQIFNNIEEVITTGKINPDSLIKADCLEAMKFISDESVDAIICDLPYGVTQGKTDIVIPFEPLWNHYKRIIKKNGAIMLFAQVPFDKVLGCSNLKWLKYEWIWEKTQATGFFNAKKMPMKAHENILIFYNKPPTYNPQKTEGHAPVNSYTKKVLISNKTEVYGKSLIDVSGGGNTDRYPRSVLKFASDKQKTKLNGTIHPNQKPLALLEYLVKTYTNEGDLILDNTMGSNTTGLACKNLNRKYIGIEKDEKWFEIAVKRI
jgi:site-specific DNA-methyltransferase (adenine-specific)